MRILLIDPPFYRIIGYFNRYFPLGLSYLAAVAKKSGHDAVILDADANRHPTRMNFADLEASYPQYLAALRDNSHPAWGEVQDTLQTFNPDVVGISVWTTFAASAFKTAQICKRFRGNLPVIAGGPHITLKAEETLRICPDIDICVRGEGEETLPELLQSLETGKGIGSLAGIKGVSFRQDGTAVHNPARPFLSDLDRVPPPARDLLLHHDLYDSEDMGLLMASRGCPFDCSYCATGIWQRKTRYRGVDNVLDEIAAVRQRYDTSRFTFKDDAFTLNKKHVLAFCAGVRRRGLAITWECNARVDLIDEELLRAMKAAGCRGVKVGIESGSERILHLMNKKTSRQQCLDAARLLRKEGIHWTGYFMMGLPSETRSEVLQTVGFMKELDPDYASLSVYEPFPGTKLYDLGRERGLIEDDRNLGDYFSISPKYYYVKDLRHRVDTMSDAELQTLEAEVKGIFHRHNQNPRKLAARAWSRSALYAHDPRFLLQDVRKFLAWLR